MPILHSPGVITPGQFGPISVELRISAERALRLHHVQRRDALGDADDDGDAGLRRLEDRVRGAGRRHVDDRRVGARLLDGLGDGVEHREAFVHDAALAGRDAADDVGAVLAHLLGVEGPGRAGDALDDQLRVFSDENRHG